MLYIFHVDTGRMMTFDMNLALESVQFLKETIERHHNLPATSQVLLVSGGEMLQPSARVCSYSAGTDTNPIYMFSTNIIESQNPPKPWPSIEADTDLKDKIEQCLELPANYNTVVKRAQLAQQCYELAKEETKICEKLVHEQHLQQQGWAAVVANMEDNTEEFKTRCDNFYRSFDEHLERRMQYLEFVAHFNKDLDHLSQIPILPSLMRCAEEIPFHAFDDYLNDSESFTKPTNPIEPPPGLNVRGVSRQNSREPTPELRGNIELGDKKIRTLSLLQWISASENQKSLKNLAENCAKGLQLFDEKAMNSLKFEAQKAIDAAQQDNMKEIKGLEDRLCGLEKLMYDARKYVQEQCELAQAFQQNQIRANNLGDASILPDLCASHCSQLLVMSKNHKHLRDIRRRITKAKEELATNLNRRLKYVIYIENRMYDIDNSLLFYHRCLRRLQRHLGIIEQIHKAPCMYVSAVTEVVRRRVFSSAFLMWASNLACQLLTIYNEEVMRRHDFSSLFEGHFLSTLFPGMNDMPPSYATEAPSIFDSSLPQLTKDDITLLSNHLPEITSKIQLPDLGAVIDFFSSRSGTLKRSDTDRSPIESSRLSDGGAEPPSFKPIEIHAHLKDYERGFESETDTEEFEKVGQSPIDRNRQGVTTISDHTQTSLVAVTTTTTSTIQQTYIKPETCSTSTSMETITTQSTETLTEVRNSLLNAKINNLRNNTSNICDGGGVCVTTMAITKTAIPNLFSSSSSSNLINHPPKKPPRSNKIIIPTSFNHHNDNTQLNHSNSFSLLTTLPSIPEIHPTTRQLKLGFNNNNNTTSSATSSQCNTSSESSPIDAINELNSMGHQTINNTNNKIVNHQMIHDEFINSEFYIDESLPSSYGSERNGESLMKELLLAEKRHNDYDDNIPCIIDDDDNRQTVFLLLQDNLGSTRLEVEKYKNLLRIMLKLSNDSVTLLKQQLKEYRDTTESEKVKFKAQLTELSEKWNQIMVQTEAKQQNLIHKIHAENEQKLCDFKKNLLDKTDKLDILETEKLNIEEEYMKRVVQLQNENENLKKTIGELDEKIKLFESRIESVDTDKAKALTELKEKLIHEHKTEIESLRCRFKLMTYMERSPSDTSLEKIERPEMIEISNHESILLQTKEDLEQEKEMAIKIAIEKERARHENYPNSPFLISGSPRSPTTSSSDLYKRILDEKERQIDTMRERETILIKENQKFRDTIQQLADCEYGYGDQISMLKTQFDSLQRDKQKLAEELEMERSKRVEMERSVTAIRSESKFESTIKDLATSPEPSRPRSRLSNPSKSVITFTSCTEGDHVMVVWNNVHGQYTIVQDAPILYFLHGDSYAPLNLQQCAHGELPKTIYCYGVVVVKEYCHARKDENRYKVSKGTKFYRVKVNPRKCDVSKAQQKREKLDSCGGSGGGGGGGSGGGGGTSSSSESVSRSTSTEKCNQSFQFIDSFAQTELDPVLEDSVSNSNTTSKDMIDSGVAKSICKERNISITEDESDDRCRYVIMSDELSQENTSEEDYGNQSQISATPTILLEDHELHQEFDDHENNNNDNSDSNEKLHRHIEHPNDDDSDEYRSLESQ